VDETNGMSYAMDMTPMMQNASLTPADFVQALIHRFGQDVNERIGRMS
jgi:hypothetical protein